MSPILGSILAFAAVAAVAGILAAVGRRRLRHARREQFIRDYDFGQDARLALERRRPELGQTQLRLGWEALRQYFLLCQRAGPRRLPMPSQLADDAWHVMILDTRRYAEFCRRAFGSFLHHHPGEAPAAARLMRQRVENNRAWLLGRGVLAAHGATGLPLLFAADEQAGIGDGFTYHAPDPARLRHAGPSNGGSSCSSSGCSGGGNSGHGGHGGCSGHSGCSGGCSGGCGGGH